MKKILIVEDSPSVYLPIKEQLEETNMFNEIIIAEDGKSALDLILNEEIDIIILDLKLPVLSGTEILKILEKNNIERHIIVMSGEQQLITEMIQLNLNIEAYFSKPFEIERLMRKVVQINKIYSIPTPEYRKIITSYLDEFNFNKTSIGYTYIIDCLLLCIKEKRKVIPKMTLLYQNVANRYEMKNSININWSITKCIKSMLKSTPPEIISKYFNHTLNPSSKIFLNTSLQIIQREINKDYCYL